MGAISFHVYIRNSLQKIISNKQTSNKKNDILSSVLSFYNKQVYWAAYYYYFSLTTLLFDEMEQKISFLISNDVKILTTEIRIGQKFNAIY